MMSVDTVNPIEFFKQISLFVELDDTEIFELLREMERVFFTPGQKIFEQGDVPDGLYVIERGEVSVTIKSPAGTDLMLARLGNGSVVGEMALIDGSPRSATVSALTLTEGYYLSQAKFEAMRSGRAAYAYKTILQLARTLEERRKILEHQIQRMREDPDRTQRAWGDPTRELIARVRKG